MLPRSCDIALQKISHKNNNTTYLKPNPVNYATPKSMYIGIMDTTPRRQRGPSRNQRNGNPKFHGCFNRNVAHASEPGPVESREEKIAKQVGWVLRHGAEKEGLRVNERGFVGCGDLVRFEMTFSILFPEVLASCWYLLCYVFPRDPRFRKLIALTPCTVSLLCN